MVHVWRSNNKIRGWVGPGVVVCVNQQRTSAWVSMRGVVVKCSFDRIRRATDEEWLGAKLVKIFSNDALERMQRQGQRGYVDTAGEDPPPDDAKDFDLAKTTDLIVDPDEHRMDTTSPDDRLLSSIPEDQPVVDEPVELRQVASISNRWENRPEFNIAPSTPIAAAETTS